MSLLVRSTGDSSVCRLLLAVGTILFAAARLSAGEHEEKVHYGYHVGRFSHKTLESGTLGWAEYGLYPGLYGFSLRWHPGYGYGKYALGVGADGGYPFYGGPGYPHQPPPLRRFGPAAPYAYMGGPPPGYPICGWTNFYQDLGGLVVDKPVVSIGEPGDIAYVGENGERAPGADFGQFTGALPYPETYFAPYASAAAATGSSGSEGPAKPALPAPGVFPAPGAPPQVPGVRTPFAPPPAGPSAANPVQAPAEAAALATLRLLGIEEETVVDGHGVRGIRVAKVYPGSPSDAAGLHEGDVIHTLNGYLTEDRGNVAWIMSVAAPDHVLKMSVLASGDGQEHSIVATLASNAAVDLSRPGYLPAVGNGPPPATR